MIETPKITSGSRILDKLLKGGYEGDVITTLYGPAGVGKTGLCILCAVRVARTGKKVLYIDTESNFSVDRCRQICESIKFDPLKILSNIIFLRPTNFDEQKTIFNDLDGMIKGEVGLVVVDSIAMLYRLEMGKTNDVYEINKELGRQIATLTNIAQAKKIPILLTNQVYADFEEKDAVKIVGGDILKYGSKCLIELQKTNQGTRKAILRKHRSIPEGREINFKIVEGGILGVKPEKKFRLF